MTTRLRLAAVAAGALCLVGAAYAQVAAEDAAVKARKAHMQVQAFYLGQLGAMAKGDVAYDATTAGVLAADLAALSSVDQRFYWIPATAQGEVEGSRLLPNALEEGSDIIARAEALNTAVAALVTAAGTDLAALQAAMGPVGQACGACHEAHRAPQ
jgi:cytochrome c556